MEQRAWVPRALGGGGGGGREDGSGRGFVDLRVVSYNLLAEELEDNTTLGLDPTIASFTYRKDLLCEELLKWDADVICLQEVYLPSNAFHQDRL